MTAQEIYEQDGFLVWCASRDHKIGDVVIEATDWSVKPILPEGTKGVVIGELTEAEAESIVSRHGHILRPHAHKFYKVIAE